MATPSQGSEPDIPTELTEAVRRGQWREVLRLVHTEDCSPQQRHWAIHDLIKNAPESFLRDRLDEICDSYADNDSLLSHLLTRRLWRCVGRVLLRNISHTQHRQAVEEASRHADEEDFAYWILDHCTDEELEQVFYHMVSRGLWEPIEEVTDMARFILSRLMSKQLWAALSRFLQRNISVSEHRWAVEQASRQCDDDVFVLHILPRCGYDEELDSVLTHLVSRGLWWSVGEVLERSVSSSQHRWAVEQASRHADERTFVRFILHHCTDDGLEQVFSHMVSRGLWKPVDSVTDMAQYILSWLMALDEWHVVGSFLQRNVSGDVHRWALEQASEQCDDDRFVDYILPHCYDEELDSMLTNLVSQGLWKSVGEVLERGVSYKQLRWAVEQASKQCDDDRFVAYILRHCYGEEMDSVLTRLVSRGLWVSVSKVLKRGVSSTQHRWAVEQASERCDDNRFVDDILPQCHDEELDSVLTNLVSRGLWKTVSKVLKRCVSSTQHRWAVEQASEQCDDDVFVEYILPHCWDARSAVEQASERCDGDRVVFCSLPHRFDEELDSVLTHLVSRGLWRSVGKVLKRGGSSSQHRWAVEQASRHADEKTFTSLILPQVAEEDLQQVFSHMVTRGLWEPVDNVADMARFILSRLMSSTQWDTVGKILQRNSTGVVRRWAVEQASKQCDDDRFVKYILFHCYGEEMDSVLTHLVSRGLWKSVGKVLKIGGSSIQHMWAVEQASEQCDDDRFADDILPHCYDEELDSVLTDLVSRGLWRSVGEVLKGGVGSTQHMWAVEEASRHAAAADFVQYILHRCYDEELIYVLPHLISRGLWDLVEEVLKTRVIPSLYISSVIESVEHIDDSNYHVYMLRHCNADDDVVAVLSHLVANKKWTCVQHVLWTMARDTLHTWITSEHGSRSCDTLIWKVIHNCQVDGSLAFGLTKAATQQMTYNTMNLCWERCHNVSSDLAYCISWQRSLCELFITTLLRTVCDMMCNDYIQYEDSTENIEQRISEIYTHITAFIRDNTHCVNCMQTVIQNKEKWTSLFTELGGTHSNDPLFLFHFMQGLNLYHTSSLGENDDFIFLVMLAVFPLFPQLQSVALRMMLREKRWNVISQACLSHVWEHDRRRLFKAAVMQRQWDVVRQWCDHTVHDDQRHWALTEAFKEKQWEVYLLLADHGLTVDEQMYAHYRVAKYGHWATVLNMVDRGGDITEVSNLLEKWVMRYLRKKPEGDVTVYKQRCMKLIRLRLRFARNSALSLRKALERCLWGTVLFNILHKPTKRFFSEVLDKVVEEQQWHVLMHLVRLGMTSADRDRLFPDMVRQQQWGVCRQLLEHGVDDQLCLEALPELMEKKQWMLVARVMEHDMDDSVRRQLLLWAFQRRAGALFWHCINLLEDQKHLSTAVKEQLFHQAISREIWQAVKPLVKEKAVRHLEKEKDGPNIQRRDLAFLEAIDQHLWDVVDYCQRLGADMNMKDENGETPLNREARKREWKAVEEIVLRDGDSNHLDKDGVSVMNRLMHHKQWDIVKVVIKYGGDIHLSARHSAHSSHKYEKHTPLQALITARQADVIHSTIKWCGGQDWGVNDKGERVLHAVCDSNRWDVMRDLIDIKVNPLVLTNTGKSPLAYAVLNTKCGQRMVAECSRQGFSFHQPSLTGPQETLLQDVSQAVVGFSSQFWSMCTFGDHTRRYSTITSPLVCAVLCELPVVAFMLYESGSCSNAELFTLHTQLPKLTDLNTEEGRRLGEEVEREATEAIGLDNVHGHRDASAIMQRYSRLTHTLKQSTAFIRELATTPRPLLSSCRLKILQSPCFHFSHKYREKAMGYDYLRLPESLKEYLKFSDLCDPDYGGHMK